MEPCEFCNENAKLSSYWIACSGECCSKNVSKLRNGQNCIIVRICVKCANVQSELDKIMTGISKS